MSLQSCFCCHSGIFVSLLVIIYLLQLHFAAETQEVTISNTEGGLFSSTMRSEVTQCAGWAHFSITAIE